MGKNNNNADGHVHLLKRSDLLSDVMTKINNCSWADWNLKKIEIDFEKITILVSNSEDETLVNIICIGYVGFQIIGHWDEAIIEDIKVENEGNLINDSIKMVRKQYGDEPVVGGGVKNIDDTWFQVNIKLIDGIYIRVACKSIEAR